MCLVRYYALSAASALFKYTEIKLNTQFANGSLRIRYLPVDGTMMIDPETVRNLEIVGNMGNAKSPHSLFGCGLLQYLTHRHAFTLPQRPESLLYRHGKATLTRKLASPSDRHILAFMQPSTV
jgi:hypothetical protein